MSKIQSVIETHVAPSIPERHNSALHYGSHWSNQRGQSGYNIQHKGYWFRCQQRPDLSWGTQREAERDSSNTTVTLREFRAALNAIIDDARSGRRGDE